MNLQQLFKIFIDSRPGTYTQKNYKRRLKEFAKTYGNTPIDEIEASHINDWWQSIARMGYAPATNAGYRQSVKALFNHAVKSGLLALSPAKHLKVGSYASQKDKLPNMGNVAKIDELARVWVADGDMRQKRAACAWLLSRDSGGRLRELVNVRLSAVQNAIDKGADGNGVYVVRSHGKTGISKLRFSSDTAQALQVWINSRPGDVASLFSTTVRRKKRGEKRKQYGALSRSALQKDFVYIARCAGVKAVYPHTNRHIKGTEVTRKFNPKIAQHYLNHKSLEITLNMYYHPSEDEISAAVIATAPGA